MIELQYEDQATPIETTTEDPAVTIGQITIPRQCLTIMVDQIVKGLQAMSHTVE